MRVLFSIHSYKGKDSVDLILKDVSGDPILFSRMVDLFSGILLSEGFSDLDVSVRAAVYDGECNFCVEGSRPHAGDAQLVEKIEILASNLGLEMS